MSIVTLSTTAPELPKEKSGVPEGTNLNDTTVSIWFPTGENLFTNLNGEQNGDVLDDAIYNQNLAVEERLNCNLEFTEYATNNQNDHREVISKLLLADDTTYDLFFGSRWSASKNFRDMKDDYGIIPMPKVEADDEYKSTLYEGGRLAYTPYNCKNYDAVCAVLEELAFEGYTNLLPVYYDTVLKTKYARDDISAQMIDLIRDNITLDIAVIYGSNFNGLCYLPRTLISEGNSDFASNYAALEEGAKTMSAKLIETLQGLN